MGATILQASKYLYPNPEGQMRRWSELIAAIPAKLQEMPGPASTNDMVSELSYDLRQPPKWVAKALCQIAETHPEWATRSTISKRFMGRDVYPWIWKQED